MIKQKIKPCLWFNDQAEEAMNFYISVFPHSKVGDVSYYGDAGPGTKGSVMVVTFQLEGQDFMGLNGGPNFKFNEALSLVVECESQEEVDEFWEKLSEGGQKSQCGWLKDKYGLSWQIVPAALGKLMTGLDKEKTNKVMQALLKMTKIDLEALRKASGQ
ncbi:MAG TPA: VOC family protein [Chitinophagaceae bacterium]|nr:VOC family protein [Chitinophagaceae bacterium]